MYTRLPKTTPAISGLKTVRSFTMGIPAMIMP